MPTLRDVTLQIVRAPSRDRQFEDASSTDLASVSVAFTVEFIERELTNDTPWSGSVQLVSGQEIEPEFPPGTLALEGDVEIPFVWQEGRLSSGLFLLASARTFSVTPSRNTVQRVLNGLMRQRDLDVNQIEIPDPNDVGTIPIPAAETFVARVVLERDESLLFAESEPFRAFFEMRGRRRGV